MWTVRDAVQVEKAGKPVVAIITSEFLSHAENVARTEGHSDLKLLVLPYPLETRSDEEIDEIADRAWPRFLDIMGIRR